MAKAPATQIRYTTTDSLPVPFVFLDRALTKSPSPKVQEYLVYMLTTHPDDLEWLWRRSQQYVKHGGMYVVTFDKWRQMLKTTLKAQGYKL